MAPIMRVQVSRVMKMVVSASDFVIVKFAGKKSKSYNYVGLVENVEGDKVSESKL